MPLLYVDVLGMKHRWRTGGVTAAKAAFEYFYELVGEAIDEVSAKRRISATGGVQTDSAALDFTEVLDAIEVGRSLLRNAFRVGTRDERVWLRGVIVPTDGGVTPLEAVTGLRPGLILRQFSDDLLGAINLEQSGFRGHRLLVDASLVSSDVTEALQIHHQKSYFHPLCELTHSSSPDGYVDFLWMVPRDTTESDWGSMRIAMSNRLRWSASTDDLEFVQAASTQLVFEECQAILESLP